MLALDTKKLCCAVTFRRWHRSISMLLLLLLLLLLSVVAYCPVIVLHLVINRSMCVLRFAVGKCFPARRCTAFSSDRQTVRLFRPAALSLRYRLLFLPLSCHLDVETIAVQLCSIANDTDTRMGIVPRGRLIFSVIVKIRIKMHNLYPQSVCYHKTV